MWSLQKSVYFHGTVIQWWARVVHLCSTCTTGRTEVLSPAEAWIREDRGMQEQSKQIPKAWTRDSSVCKCWCLHDTKVYAYPILLPLGQNRSGWHKDNTQIISVLNHFLRVWCWQETCRVKVVIPETYRMQWSSLHHNKEIVTAHNSHFIPSWNQDSTEHSQNVLY